MTKENIIEEYNQKIKILEKERDSILDSPSYVNKQELIDYLASENFVLTSSVEETVYTKKTKDFKILVIFDFENQYSGSYIDLEYYLINNSNIKEKHLYSENYDVFSLDEMTLDELKLKLNEIYKIHFKIYKVEIIFKAISEEKIDFSGFIDGCIFDLHNENNIQINNTYYGEV